MKSFRKNYLTTEKDNLIRAECDGIQILPPSSGIPLPCTSYRDFYNPSKLSDVQESLKGSFAFHYCNKKRTGLIIYIHMWRSKWHLIIISGTDFPKTDEYKVDPKHPLYITMKQHCPFIEKIILRKWIGRSYDGKWGVRVNKYHKCMNVFSTKTQFLSV